MKRFSLVAVVAVLAISIGLAACGGGSSSSSGTQTFTVTATDFKFTPADLTVKANQPVEVTLKNNGSTAHNWTVLDLGGKNVTTGDVNPGQQGSVTFTPTTAGTYKVECTIPGHAEQGMEGELKVQ